MIWFNKSGILCSNQVFAVNDLIYLLEHDKVYTTLGINETNQEWMHVSDQMSKQKLLNQIRFGISKGGGGLIFIAQFLFCLLHSTGHNAVYYDFSIAMTTFLGWTLAMSYTVIISCGIAEENMIIWGFVFIIFGAFSSVLTIHLFHKLAIDYPIFNGTASELHLTVTWLALWESSLS